MKSGIRFEIKIGTELIIAEAWQVVSTQGHSLLYVFNFSS